jgi:class 3 adenylate cyclase
VTLIPSVHYVRNGEFTLAYQITGTGPKDIIYLPNESPNVVGNWIVPEHVRFIERLASFARVVLADRRGMGCSDRLPPGQAPTLEELAEDLLLIMEAAYAAPATLFACGESVFIALMAAAAHPDRFEGLILWGASPSWRQSDDLPWESAPDAIEANLGAIRRITNVRRWAERWTRDVLPSWAGDEQKISLMEAVSALGGSAEAWYQDQRMFYGVDLRDLVPSVRVPTLILGRTGTRRMYRIESARYLAEHMPDATLMELEGRDVLPYVGDRDAVLEAIQGFTTGSRQAPDARRALATVMFTDIVGSTQRAALLGDAGWSQLLAEHNEVVRDELQRFDGVEVDTTGDGFLATFDGPARAVRCAAAIAERTRSIGIEIRAGVHTGEVEREGKDVRGIAVHAGARVMALAGPSEVLVSSTVRDLTAGSGLVFEDAGEHELRGVPDLWSLYRVASPPVKKNVGLPSDRP